jgi:hypothetical protein
METGNALIADANRWWKETDFSQMERITRFRQIDFDPEDGYQAFVDACDTWWKELDMEEKTEIWQEYN